MSRSPSLQLSLIALEATGVQTISALPSAAICPGCHGELDIEFDRPTSGLWLSCRGCGAYGNIVEFSASIGKVDLEEAARRLDQQLPTGASGLLASQLAEAQNRLAILGLFESDRTARLLSDSDTLRRLLTSRHADTSSPGWQAGLEGLAYAVTAKEYREIFCGGRGLAGCGSDLVILPYWDRPGRAAGMRILRAGYEGEICDTYVSAWAASDSGGLLNAHLLRQDGEEQSRTVVALLDDPWTVIAMHCLDRRVGGGGYLPLVGARSTLPGALGKGFSWPGRSLVLWTGTQSPAAISAARILDVPLAVLPYSSESLPDLPMRRWLQVVESRARPWRDCLETLVETASYEEIRLAIGILSLDAGQIQHAAGAWNRATRDRFLEVAKPIMRVAQVGECRYEEFNGLLLRTSPDGQVDTITNHPIHIDTVVRTPRQLIYRGHLLHPGGQVAFASPASEVRKGSSWIEKILAGADLSPGIVPTPHAWRCSILAAMQMSPPRRIVAAKQYGWDEKSKSFVFDRFRIRANGSVEVSESMPWLGAVRPTAQLLLPREIPATGLRDLLVGHPGVVGLVSAIAVRLVAGVLGKAVQPLAINCGDSLKLAKTSRSRLISLARLLGCVSADGDPDQTGCGWPLFVDWRGKNAKKGRKRLYKPRGSPIMLVTRSEVEALRLEGRWQKATKIFRFLPSCPPAGSAAEEALLLLIPCFLQYLGSKLRFGLPKVRGGFTAAVHTAVTSWLSELPGAQGIKFRAAGILEDSGSQDLPSRAAGNFARMMRSLHTRGWLPPLDLSDASYELNPRETAAQLQRICKITVRWRRLRRLLKRARVLVGRQGAGTDAEIWSLKSSWWQKQVVEPVQKRLRKKG